MAERCSSDRGPVWRLPRLWAVASGRRPSHDAAIVFRDSPRRFGRIKWRDAKRYVDGDDRQTDRHTRRKGTRRRGGGYDGGHD